MASRMAYPVSGEYVLDIDSYLRYAPHGHRTEPEGFGYCCLRNIKEWTERSLDAVTENYSDVRIVFSGKRGFHVHVLDFDARDWTKYDEQDPLKSHEVARFLYSLELQKKVSDLFDESHFKLSSDVMRVITVPESLNGESSLVCSYLGGPKEFTRMSVEEIMRANESGFNQLANIVKLQDPEVDVRIAPGYGYRIGSSPLNLTYQMVDKHTSICDPRWINPYLSNWMEAEMDWNFISPPDEVCRHYGVNVVGPEIGVVLGPGKILIPAPPVSTLKGIKWLESIGIEVVQVDCSSIVVPRRDGFFHCTVSSLIRDAEPTS